MKLVIGLPLNVSTGQPCESKYCIVSGLCGGEVTGEVCCGVFWRGGQLF